VRAEDLDLLRAWLGPLPVERFAAEHLGRDPVARPGTAASATSLLDWDVLARVLAAEDPRPDVLVVARGRLLPLPAPRSLETLRGYLARGIGLCLRFTERCDLGLARVAESFAGLGAAHVQLFVTPGGTHGFGWHFDEEHVFVVQTAGVKEYFFRANTATAERATGAAFRAFAREASPVLAATLVPGDFLYLPARWWHMALCREDALSISVGVTLHGASAGS